MKKILYIVGGLVILSLLAKLFGITSAVPSSESSSKADSTAVDTTQVTIGSQVWMPLNLDVDRFRNGDRIPQAKTDEEWVRAGQQGKPVWCYNKNDPSNGVKYGKIYNGYAVLDPRGLAPKGWHIPTHAEFRQLLDYLNESDAPSEARLGDLLKADHGWTNAGNGIYKNGFNALPAGVRDYDGLFTSIGEHAAFWSSTEDIERNLKYISIAAKGLSKMNRNWWTTDRNNDAGINKDSALPKEAGNSVRCVRD